MHVPLLDLTRQYQTIQHEVEPAVLNLFRQQTFILGPVVARFEQHCARYCQCHHAVGVSSGTDALLCSLMALGIKSGDEVILPTFTFFGTAGTVARLGATPIFVDIDPDHFNIDVGKIASALTPRTKAVIPVHLFGQMAPMEQIKSLAREHNLGVIEDACQAIGARRDDRTPGQWSDCACLSFYPSKNLAAFGDAGMILTQNESLAQKCRHLRMHGEDKRYYHSMIGGNFRLDALQALVLDIKLKYLDRWIAARRENAALYDQLLGDAVGKPKIDPENYGVYHQYVIRAQRRDELKEYLASKQIGAAVYYPVPLHLQQCFRYLGGQPGDCPVAEQMCREVLALPIYPELTQEQITYVADAINSFYDL